MSCIIRDSLHTRTHKHWKGQLTPPVKEIRQTIAEILLQWLAENRQKDILFTYEKIFTIEGSTTVSTIRFMLKRLMR
jgi:hypothetical protein